MSSKRSYYLPAPQNRDLGPITARRAQGDGNEGTAIIEFGGTAGELWVNGPDIARQLLAAAVEALRILAPDADPVAGLVAELLGEPAAVETARVLIEQDAAPDTAQPEDIPGQPCALCRWTGAGVSKAATRADGTEVWFCDSKTSCEARREQAVGLPGNECGICGAKGRAAVLWPVEGQPGKFRCHERHRCAERRRDQAEARIAGAE